MNYCEKFKALSDPIRLDILDKFSLSHSKISYHLSILKKVNMVLERKYKNYIYYTLNLKGVEDTMSWFNRFR